jgi:hypothetical protein
LQIENNKLIESLTAARKDILVAEKASEEWKELNDMTKSKYDKLNKEFRSM